MEISGFYHLAFRTKPQFVAPDITFLATHPVTVFRTFGSVIVQEAKITLFILRWPLFFYQRVSLLLLYLWDYFHHWLVILSLLEKRPFLFPASFRFWSEVRWKSKTIEKSICSMFCKDIFINNSNVGLKACDASYSCSFVSRCSAIFPALK